MLTYMLLPLFYTNVRVLYYFIHITFSLARQWVHVVVDLFFSSPCLQLLAHTHWWVWLPWTPLLVSSSGSEEDLTTKGNTMLSQDTLYNR